MTTNAGALTTTGGSNGDGGAVTATATGGTLVAAAITASGGTALSGTMGRNAGAVTLSGAGAVTTGAITASGSNGVGAGRAGGQGGVINLASNGTLASGALAASGGNGVATAAGGHAGTITVSNNGAAGTLTTGTLTARTGAAAGAIVSGNAGSIAVTNNAATQLQTGAINSSGQAGGAGGNVTLVSNGNVTVTSTLATGGGALVAATNAAGRNGGNLVVTAGGTVSLGGAVTTSGGNAVAGNNAGGHAGAISLDAGGATPIITVSGNLTATGGNRSGTGVAGAGGAIAVADTLNIGAANRTISSRGGSAGLGQGGDIMLAGPIHDSGTRTLTVTGGSGTVTLAGGPANATLANNLDTLVVTASDGAGKIRVGSVNTVATQSYDSGSGGIELDGDVVTLGSAAADTVTFSDPVTLTGDSSITTAGGAGDHIAVSQTVNGAYDLTLNAGALGTVTTSAVIGGSTPLGDFSATGAAVTFGRSVSADSIFARSTTGNLTLNTAGTVLTGSGAGDAIQLVASGAASRFVNTVGATALNASHASGRFLVWSQNPANDTRGALAYAFKQYNATYGVTAVADADSSHDGFLYTLAPSITPALTGTVSKPYDGTATAALTAAHFTAGGAIDGDVVTLSGSGSYDNKNVGVAKTVTATGIAASAVNGAAAVYGYAVSPGTVSAAIGTITAAPLTVTAQTDTRVYDGTTHSAVAPLLRGTTYDAIGTAAIQSYDNRNVGTAKTLTASGLVMNDGNGGANYAISYVSDSSGVITAAPLTVTAQTDSRVYDGTTNSAVAPLLRGTTLRRRRHRRDPELRQQERRDGQDAHRQWSGDERRQRRRQLCDQLRQRQQRRDHGSAADGDGADRQPGLRRHHQFGGGAAAEWHHLRRHRHRRDPELRQQERRDGQDAYRQRSGDERRQRWRQLCDQLRQRQQRRDHAGAADAQRGHRHQGLRRHHRFERCGKQHRPGGRRYGGRAEPELPEQERARRERQHAGRRCRVCGE